MLFDNKTKSAFNKHYKVFEFISDYVEKGRLDIVTGFFSISALARMFDEINDAKQIRMILGTLIDEKNRVDKIINLLSDRINVNQALNFYPSLLSDCIQPVARAPYILSCNVPSLFFSIFKNIQQDCSLDNIAIFQLTLFCV